MKSVDPSVLLKDILLAPIYDIVEHTPLTELTDLSARTGHKLWLKREDLQKVFSFKIRGAHNKIKKLAKQGHQSVITASAGNHAQGVALSASTLGLSAKIVMPITTPGIKVDAVKRFGGEAVLHGETFDEANDYAQQLAQESGAVFVPPFNDIDVIAGQGTVAKELLEQHDHLDAVFVPVGGGGLLAGVAFYIKQLAPHIKVIAVEDETAASFGAAWRAGEPVLLDYVGSFADGMAVKKVGNVSFDVANQFIDDCITVSSDEICSAIKDIFDDQRVCVEPSGAVALAGSKKWLKQQDSSDSDIDNKAQPVMNIAAICSGANLNFNTLGYVSERTELGANKEAILAVKIPEQKGSFLNFCKTLGPLAVTEFNYRFQPDLNEAEIFVGLKLRQGHQELEQVFHRLAQGNFAFTDLSNNEMAKLHGRHLIGGKLNDQFTERLYRFEFPEHVGALSKFLSTLGDGWNITLFHYRNHGAAIGQVLCGFNVSTSTEPNTTQQLTRNIERLHQHLDETGFDWFDETDNPIFELFLK
ncbi:threonine ammonia-lyase, biosynthetic [Psychrosphaera ytuae]|uniref:L-threonine dehydratase n=1 Tax=Psychrosphaera ytuae TaxID=2820710 RepID=A0A975DES2_9GAMM|nr:threonine ammonia-lyase, biosynthetic [Psychrosphaera ytuae]QTH65066.1 threonine ammonia-lyase, biosynthetic [Psychrosphaera ytuae]